MKNLKLTFLFLVFFSASIQAEDIITTRIQSNFDTAMITIKEKLNEYGYTIAHIQKCDGGLSGKGYKTDSYKSIFFGKFEEMRKLTKEHPTLMPYLPMKLLVIKEESSIVLVILNPSSLKDFFPDPELNLLFSRWESDFRAILDEVNAAELKI